MTKPSTTTTHSTTAESENSMRPRRFGLRRIYKALLAVALGVAATAAAAQPAMAQFGIVPGSFFADTYSPITGEPVTQAGAHPPEATTSFELNLKPDNLPFEPLHDTIVDLPNGFTGNPRATPRCSRTAFNMLIQGVGNAPSICPAASQVGVATIKLDSTAYPNNVAIYNVEPVPGDVADFGFVVQAVPVHIIPKLDPARGYALRAVVDKASQGLAVVASKVTLWGVPADPSHDNPNQRGCSDAAVYERSSCPLSGVKREPFLTNPSTCVGPVTTRVAIDSWKNRGVYQRDSYTTASGGTGCERLRFEPSVDLKATTSSADAPSGLSARLRFAQNGDPDGLGTPPLRTAKVTLPEGLTINPGAAGGLEACSDAQLGLGTDAPIACPEASKIGSASAETPLLTEKLTGSVYVRSQASDDPESGEMFRLALVLENAERGLLIKLPGSAKVNEQTGRVVAEFAENPQQPVSKIDVDLKSGSRAPLATPAACGTHRIGASLLSWGGQQPELSSPIDIACRPGLGGFAPSMSAGTTSGASGAFAPFTLNLNKPDGNVALNGLSMELPEGLLANLKGNVGTQVGSVRAYAGPGGTPFMLPGKVFLEGAYGDAPFSLRAVVPAKAGPFDLGEVVVRQKLYVDPNDAHVTVVSDPLPTIVKGVPVRLQRLDVDVDKTGFVMNPTSCKRKEIKATLGAADGQTAPITNRFQVGECSDLRFTPKLAMRLTGKNQTRTGGHPALKTVLTQAKGQSNIDKAKVTLPKTVVLDAVNSFDPKLVCDYDKSLKADCPASSIIGKATAQTPVLNKPLTGNVHLVQGIKFGPKGNRIRTTPALLVKLRGEVAINLRAQTTTEKKTNRLVTTFPAVPDAPVSKFSLTINGGKNGILVVTRTRKNKINLCSNNQIASVETDGQNGADADYNTKIKTPCAKKAKRSKTRKR